MSMVATLSGRAPLKGLTAAGLGLMIAMVGSRAPSGTLRWTFDWLYLWDGVPLIPATLGLFALPELCELAVSRRRIAGEQCGEHRSVEPMGRRARRRAELVAGAALRRARHRARRHSGHRLGGDRLDRLRLCAAHREERGDIRHRRRARRHRAGSSNNAKEGGHLVPTIAFGVPAGASMAILLGAFLMHGLTPGPEMLTKHLDLTYMIVWSLTLAHVIGAVICLACSRCLAQVSRIRPGNPAAGHHRAGLRRRIRRRARLGRPLFAGVFRRHRLDHETARLAAAADGARHRGRRDLRALSVHLDAALRLAMAAAACRPGDSRLRSLGAVSADLAYRCDPRRRVP